MSDLNASAQPTGGDRRHGTSRGPSLRIADDVIDSGGDCYVIAEIGQNHQGSVETAKELFDAAKRCGADAVKLQKRDNRSLYTKEFFNKPYENENSFGATYGLHREALEFGRSEYVELKTHAQDLGITFLATAFDLPSVDFLEDVNIPAYKIASADLINTPLLRRVAETDKPMILSTGAATLTDVRRAYETVAAINDQLAILQCTAGYPAAWGELDLRVICTYRELFPDTVIGLSSHDNGIAMAVAAYALGARVIEKHFTLDRTMRGTEHGFSLEPQGLQKMVRDLRRVGQALGDGTKRIYASESEPSQKMAKQLVAVKDLPASHVLRHQDIAARSPGGGLPAYEIDRLVGRSLRQPVARDTALTFDVVEQPVLDIVAGHPVPAVDER